MLIIAHRGASRAAAENSIEAFRLADAMGSDGVELDVRLAPDGRLLVRHDPLPAWSAVPGGIVDDHHAEPADLAAVLEACGDMLVNVEIKNTPDEPGFDPTLAVVEPTIAAMRRHASADRFIVSSFHWATIERCRELAPDIATAFLTVDVAAGLVERTAAAGHGALHPHHRHVTADLVERCRAAGIAVNTWTCNDPDRIVELADLGVDGVCTDVPDVALTALGRRLAHPVRRWGPRG